MTGSSRTYGQMCGLAASLDLLGERWTMLILRELARGPKRFGDLSNGLDGIGTNLLSDRLKTLERSGTIEKILLPAPASVQAYALTERGRELQPILEDLADWGFELLPAPNQSPGLKVRPAWAAMSMRTAMERSESRPPEGIYSFDVDGENFWLKVSPDGSALTDGPAPVEPDVAVEISVEDFFGMATGNMAVTSSAAKVGGDAARLQVLMETFRLPPLP
ncbi:MAG: winged helix-turn-helix transcriptional regulator [Solirubrobacterales bacterium]